MAQLPASGSRSAEAYHEELAGLNVRFGWKADMARDAASGKRRLPGSGANRLSGLLAGLLAATAMLGTDAAMIVLAGVLLTFFSTETAGDSAGLHGSNNRLLVASRAPRSERPSR